MNKVLKKIFSCILSLLCVISLIPAMSVNLSAEEVELNGWSGYDGYYEISTSGISLFSNGSNNFLISDSSAKSFELEAEVDISSSVGGFVFGASSNDGTNLGRDWYGVHIGNNRIRLFYEKAYWDSSLPKLDVTKDISGLGSKNTVKVAVNGKNIIVYVNGTEQINTTYDGYNGGYVGFCNYATTSNYNNVRFNNNDFGSFTAANASNFSEADGKITLNKLTNANNFVLSNASAKSFTLEADVNLAEGSVAGFVFGAPSNNPSSIGADWVSLQVESSKRYRLFYEKNHSTLNKYVNDSGINLNSVHLKLVVDGTNIKVYANNATDPIYNETLSTYAGGYIGFCSWNAKAEFTNVKFTNNDKKALGNYKGFEGKYSVGDSDAIVLKDNNGNNYLVSDTQGTDFTMEAMVDTRAGGVGGFLFAAAQASPSGLGTKWNAIHIHPTQVRLFCESTWNKPGGLNVYADITNNGGLNKLKVEVKGTTIKVYVNDELKITATQDTYEGGYVGLCNYNTTTTFTDVSFSNDEPTGFLTNLGAVDTWFEHSGSWSEPIRGYRESSTAGGDMFSISNTWIPAGSSFVIEADIHIENSNGGGGIVFVQDKNNPSSKWYCANVDKPWQKGAKLFKNMSGAQTLYASNTFSEAEMAMKNYHIRLELLDGGTFNYYLNGELVGSGTESSFEGGYIGLITFNGSDVTFNNVYYYAVTAPELINLSVKDLSLDKPFDAKTLSYRVTASDDSEKAIVYATPKEGLVVYIQNNKISDPSAGTEVSLQIGYTNVDIKVVDPESGVSKTYTVSIYRAPDQDTIYDGDMRAQLHFSPQINWMNDPNGLVYNPYSKEYHLFYQHNPYGTNWGHMSWGHAVSTDLVNWEELPIALFPDEFGTRWSGSGVIDYKNTTGFFDENTPPENRMVLIPMLNEVQGSGVGLAYSTDGGRTFIEYEDGDFVFRGAGDPKVFWYEDDSYANGGIWLMLNTASDLYSSPNLIDWTHVGDMFHKDGKTYNWECQDFYPLEVLDEDGNPTGETKWVYNAAGSWYTVGRLVKDGDKFNYYAETEEILYNGDSHQWNETFFSQPGDHLVYATQSYFNDAKDRRVSISWIREGTGKTYDSTKGWNGFQSLAMETTLRKIDGKYRLYSYPVEELEDMRSRVLFETSNETVASGTNILSDVKASLYDIETIITLGENTEEVGFSLRGKDGKDVKVYYKVADQKLYVDKSNSVGYKGVNAYEMTVLDGNKIKLRIVVDNAIIEAFGNDGMAPISVAYTLTGGTDMGFYVKGDNVVVDEMTIWSLDSIWKEKEPVLTDLAVSEGTLDKAFSESIYEYSVEVTEDIAGITVTPTYKGKTTVKVHGEEVISGSASSFITLDYGYNDINVEVTYGDSDPNIYTIKVFRAEPKMEVYGIPEDEIKVGDEITIYTNLPVELVQAYGFDETRFEVVSEEDGVITLRAIAVGEASIECMSKYGQVETFAVVIEKPLDISGYIEATARLENASAEDFTEASVKDLLEIDQRIEELLNDEDTTQEEFDEAVDDLNDAIDALVNVVSLRETFDRVGGTDTSGCTEESAKAFEDALANAEAALIDGTQEEVDEAEKTLVEAYNALEEKEETIPGGNTGEEEDDSPEGSNTGDTTNVGGLMMLLLASGYVLSRRKKA